ncbi:MAG: acyltransferase, partial [Bacteriovoracaceae bacterium]|nr:acyltransferase [Bacteriovoracaceae bacterium]
MPGTVPGTTAEEGKFMGRMIKAGIIQMATKLPTSASCDEHRASMIESHLKYIEEAGTKGVQMLCMQEVFTGPYFCPSQDTKWYGLTEKIPDGPTTKLMCDLAKKHKMVIVVPIYVEEMTGVFYNTAAVIDADGKYLGKYRKNHIPQ